MSIAISNVSSIKTSKEISVEKIETKFYLNGNKIIAQDDETNRILFYYGVDGLTGFSLNGVEYVYKKNIQNDVIGIYDANGNQLVKYVYDAWGNHKTFVLYNGKFVDISLENDYNDDNYQGKVEIAELNPFRYRSYYLDEETGLYYLNSRYYDAEIGRFINADSLTNLDKENFNGLNLFAYCLNNPVNLTDSKGTSRWSDFWEKNWDVIVGTIISAVLIIGGILLTIFTAGAGATIGIVMIGAGVGGLIGGIDSKLNGGNYWAGWLGGTVSGIITTGLGLINPIGAFFGGLIGNAVGSLITDSLNGVDLSSKNYWINLTTESIISGLLSIVGWHFGNATDILKSINLKNLFAAITVWAEFAFSYLTDMTNDLFKYIGEIFRNKSVRRA